MDSGLRSKLSLESDEVEGMKCRLQNGLTIFFSLKGTLMKMQKSSVYPLTSPLYELYIHTIHPVTYDCKQYSPLLHVCDDVKLFCMCSDTNRSVDYSGSQEHPEINYSLSTVQYC